MPSHYTILHTNDFHNHLVGKQASTLKRRLAELRNRGILFDAGDAISAGNINYKPAGEPILNVMSDIGYAAMTVGNREFHFSRRGFHCKLSMARFPILCANVRAIRFSPAERSPEGSTHIDPPVVPWRAFDLDNNFKIVVFGITVPMITERMLARKVSFYVFDDPIETASRLVPQLIKDQSPDLLIGLTHIGIRSDRLLAEQVPGIDLIIGGHTHVILSEGERVGKTLIVQAGSFGRLLGTVEVLREDDGTVGLKARVEEL